MNKNELVRKVAAKTGNTIVVTKTIVEGVLDTITETIATEPIKLTGFGTFSSKAVAARLNRNPNTGEEQMSPATRRVKFKAGVSLKEAAKS